MLRLTGGHRGKSIIQKHTDLNVVICPVMPLLDSQPRAVWIDTLVRLYARAAQFCVNKQVRRIELSSESPCEKGFCLCTLLLCLPCCASLPPCVLHLQPLFLAYLSVLLFRFSVLSNWSGGLSCPFKLNPDSVSGEFACHSSLSWGDGHPAVHTVLGL